MLDMGPPWLKLEFENASFNRTADRKVVATLPDVYTLPVPAPLLKVWNKLTHRDFQLLTQPRGIGSNEVASFADLIAHILEVSEKDALVVRHLPRAGQEDMKLKTGAIYELIHEDHPKHNHDGLALLDFVPLGLGDEGFFDFPFDDHRHLRPLGFK